jgi:hypothetical protein
MIHIYGTTKSQVIHQEFTHSLQKDSVQLLAQFLREKETPNQLKKMHQKETVPTPQSSELSTLGIYIIYIYIYILYIYIHIIYIYTYAYPTWNHDPKWLIFQPSNQSTAATVAWIAFESSVMPRERARRMVRAKVKAKEGRTQTGAQWLCWEVH